jgi:hypothetical protein
MEAEVDVREVRRVETRSGSTRFVLEDGHGNEYTTFREGIGEAAEALAGRRAVITFHEEERGRYRNVYLDSVAPSHANRGVRIDRRGQRGGRGRMANGDRGLPLATRPLRA